ncbi:MAG: phosphoribosylformylglycinamidine synthase subunit PurQ [bacterium JZ-2024 1]
MRAPRFGVAVFPGTNCEYDCAYVLSEVLKVRADLVWYKTGDLRKYDALILPGGFSYGDYLRVGAIARFAPLVSALPDWMAHGGIVLGICNGFQVLVEAGILPGALLRNPTLRYRCMWTQVRVENRETPFTLNYEEAEVLRIPIAHADGNYFADPQTLDRLERGKRIVLRFCDEKGRVIPAANPNGSFNNITGIIDETGHALGMMPHPERASERLLGSEDGLRVFTSMLTYLGMKNPLLSRRKPASRG